MLAVVGHARGGGGESLHQSFFGNVSGRFPAEWVLRAESPTPLARRAWSTSRLLVYVWDSHTLYSYPIRYAVHPSLTRFWSPLGRLKGNDVTSNHVQSELPRSHAATNPAALKTPSRRPWQQQRPIVGRFSLPKFACAAHTLLPPHTYSTAFYPASSPRRPS